MFKDTYKAANDSVNPPPELIDKVLNNKPQKKPYYYQAVKVAAVCLIFSGTLMIYPKISKNINPEQTETIIQLETTETANDDVLVTTESLPKSIETPVPEIKATEKPAKKIVSKPKKTEAPVKAEDSVLAVATEADESLSTYPDTTSTEPIVDAEATVSANQPDSLSAEPEKASGGGASANEKMFNARMVMISENEAIAVADKEFLSDFGEDFVNSSTLSVNYDNGYTVTRQNTETEASILVFDNGSFEKLY